ncbi:Metallo-dependent phosphatase-like protein [Dunaliella salina]|uniref:Metallo-dependent phosphatase-like protein n=1 Tax=Dunaliella salina TaxID=3046 RepID=A0ABQ7H6W3_DUNSA|nr:Metallo-dependent phosphatase-like protein [Dunaliella salina]|eukprot:KAF5842593.1 Metallo-dependent phosphatase-like protein [Dunaliella salina]
MLSTGNDWYSSCLKGCCALLSLASLSYFVQPLFSRRHTSSQFTPSPLVHAQMAMRIVCVSDPHGSYAQLNIPAGDLLLFAGDWELHTKEDAQELSAWLRNQPHAHKVITFGNMDHGAEETPEEVISILSKEAVVCKDRFCDVAGLRIFGSPSTPEFYGSFQLSDYADAEQHWNKLLPAHSRADIILTHGPPLGYGDTTNGRHVGDKALLEAVQGLGEPPKLWVCGHIHAARGVYKVPHKKGDILLINAALPRDPRMRTYQVNFPSMEVREGPPARGR